MQRLRSGISRNSDFTQRNYNGHGDKHPLQAEENGYWYADMSLGHVGDQYRFLLTTAKGAFKRVDPYAHLLGQLVRLSAVL